MPFSRCRRRGPSTAITPQPIFRRPGSMPMIFMPVPFFLSVSTKGEHRLAAFVNCLTSLALAANRGARKGTRDNVASTDRRASVHRGAIARSSDPLGAQCRGDFLRDGKFYRAAWALSFVRDPDPWDRAADHRLCAPLPVARRSGRGVLHLSDAVSGRDAWDRAVG